MITKYFHPPLFEVSVRFTKVWSKMQQATAPEAAHDGEAAARLSTCLSLFTMSCLLLALLLATQALASDARQKQVQPQGAAETPV